MIPNYLKSSLKPKSPKIVLGSVIKLINTRKTVLRKDYGFDEVFNISDETDNNRHVLHKYNSRTSNMINRKNEMLEYLKNYGMEAY